MARRPEVSWQPVWRAVQGGAAQPAQRVTAAPDAVFDMALPLLRSGSVVLIVLKRLKRLK